jgi:hypothetical protein
MNEAERGGVAEGKGEAGFSGETVERIPAFSATRSFRESLSESPVMAMQRVTRTAIFLRSRKSARENQKKKKKKKKKKRALTFIFFSLPSLPTHPPTVLPPSGHFRIYDAGLN